MPVLCRPAVHVPEHVITMEETLRWCRRLHAGHDQLPLVQRLISNTGVRKRHLIQPIEHTLRHPGFGVRSRTYIRQAKQRLPELVDRALEHARLSPGEIQAIVFVSCTGYTMPPLTTWMINELGFAPDTRQIPIAQLGCAAGGAAINRAHDFCTAYPGANALVVACEFCSLCYQPDDLDVGSLLSNGLFGDAMAAVAVRAEGGSGISGIALERNGSYLVPDTEDWIAYEVTETGFHFRLDRRVPGTMGMIAPALVGLARTHGWDAGGLGFYLIHAGGPRILDDLATLLNVPREAFRHSRATLADYGNIASATVLDALRRLFAEAPPAGAHGVLAGFGPGITAEVALGSWTTSDRPLPRPRRAQIASTPVRT